MLRISCQYLGLFFVCVALCGCGDSVDLYNLQGTVTFDGQPVPYGRIEFIPDNSKENSGGTGYAQILEGKYDTSQLPGRGTIGGPHNVKITAYDGKPTGGGTEDAPVAGPEVKPLFIGYEVKEDLPLESGVTKDFAVPATAKGFNELEAAKNSRPANDA